MKFSFTKITIISLVLSLFACQPALLTEQVALETSTAIPTSTSIPTQIKPTTTPTPLPTPTQTPTQTPTPVTLDAIVWVSDPVIPILNYHRFTPNLWDRTSGMVRYLGDLKADLQAYYDSGYSLISLDDLLDGNIRVPAGRRPLILTIDDAYFANQLALNDQGEVSELSAVGAIFQFSNEHPDFGFEIAMFANLGDKYFGNLFTGTWWYVAEGWQESLAQTIARGIERHVYPYNHTYRHPHLDQLADNLIQPQLALNDEKLREYLTLAGHPEYADLLSNYVALPYGSWPVSEKGVNQVTSYLDPEGDPVRAIFEAGYEYAPAFASPPFSDAFDPMHLPRMAAIPSVIKLITENSHTYPSAESCTLTLTTGIIDAQSIMGAIEQSIASGLCPMGVYVLERGVFISRDGKVVPFTPDR